MRPSEQLEQVKPEAATGEQELLKLLQRELRAPSETKREIDAAVRTLAEYALKSATLISDNAIATIHAMIAAIDSKLTEQVNVVLHHQDYQTLEGAWRGLHHLVNNTETDEMLVIRVMNISKKDLRKTLVRYPGASWDQSPLFKKLYSQEFGVLGGRPYGCIIGDYYFDHSGPDVELLGDMSKIAAAMHAPFIASASPALFQMNSWRELGDPANLTERFSLASYADWRSLRESEDSRYLGLTLPRFLARRPYGAKTNPVEEFDFEEETGGDDASKFVWANSAYAMGVNINRSFKLYGWCSRIRGVESGGAVEGLPTHTFTTDDGGVDMTCPTEIAIDDSREGELAKSGLMPLLHRKNQNVAAFIGAQSVQKPIEYDNPDATANANLSARLPYLFATCRFAHYLKCIVRDKIGSFKAREDMKRWLQDWVNQYVCGQPEHASETDKAQRPLSAAEVVVEDVEGNPGYYKAVFYLKPLYQLEGLTVSLRLVSKVPSVASA
jgi:type VI secretion system protein ImpC